MNLLAFVVVVVPLIIATTSCGSIFSLLSSSSQRRRRQQQTKQQQQPPPPTPQEEVLIQQLLPTTTTTTTRTNNKLNQIMGQVISSSNFYFYGKKHFTQTGYLNHVKSYYKDPVQDAATIGIDVDGADNINMTNRVVIVTGANSGLGKQVSTYIAAKGGRLYMLCRNKERGELAMNEIRTITNNDDVHLIVVDVSEIQQIRTAVQQIQSKENVVHGIVCNAGVLLNDKQISSEGNEATFASHLLGGTYVLTKLLLPQLKLAAERHEEPRVVIVTSGGMYNYKLPSWDYVTSTGNVQYNGVNAYAYAKRGQVILAEHWSKNDIELANSGIKFITVHPGWSDTPAVVDAFGDMAKYLKPLRTPWQGAEGITWCTCTSNNNLQSGELYLDRKIQPKHIAGAFYKPGTITQNTQQEIDEFIQKLKETADGI